MKQIINSLLQTDFYKFSMGQCIFHQHNGKITHWSFKCRNKNVKFTAEMVEELKRQVKLYSKLHFKLDELQYLKDITETVGGGSWIHDDYLGFLKFWHPDLSEITIGTDSSCGLTVEIEGPAANVLYYETPIMAIISEVYYRMGGQGDYDILFEEYKKQILTLIHHIKHDIYNIGVWSEFGFRRALSQEAHDYLIKTLVEKAVPGFLGTSNVYLAKKYNVKPMGTMAHEFVMLVGQGYPEQNPAYSNKYMMSSWVKEYGILNGIALTDTIGTPAFLKDFTLTFATLFSGVRHDSGDPFKWGDMMIDHYKKLGINPTTKTLLFSDSLTLEKAAEIYQYFKDKVKVAFGIGGAWASPKGRELNIVIKTTEVDNRPVAKLSDAPGKNMCKNPEYIDYLRKTVDWRLSH